MALYEIGTRTVTVTSGAAAAEFRSGSGQRCYVREIGISLGAATASIVGIGKPAAIGVTPTSPITALASDPADSAATAQIATAWGTAPTAPANFWRRFGMPANIGAGIVWTWWNRPLVIAVSSSIVVWNLATNGVMDVYVVFEE
jgi:hypothetical protein